MSFHHLNNYTFVVGSCRLRRKVLIRFLLWNKLHQRTCYDLCFRILCLFLNQMITIFIIYNSESNINEKTFRYISLVFSYPDIYFIKTNSCFFFKQVIYSNTMLHITSCFIVSCAKIQCSESVILFVCLRVSVTLFVRFMEFIFSGCNITRKVIPSEVIGSTVPTSRRPS